MLPKPQRGGGWYGSERERQLTAAHLTKMQARRALFLQVL